MAKTHETIPPPPRSILKHPFASKLAQRLLFFGEIVHKLHPSPSLSLPHEICLRVASFLLLPGLKGIPAFCKCKFWRGELHRIKEDNRKTLRLCAICGKLTSFAVEILPALHIGVGIGLKVGWRNCNGNHMHIEMDGTIAVRHRSSRIHSHRCVVANEWLFRGSATYKLTLRQLAVPGGIGIGIVSQKAKINECHDWVPGLRQQSWGFIGAERSVSQVPGEAIPLLTCACFMCTSVPSKDVDAAQAIFSHQPELQAGDVVSVNLERNADAKGTLIRISTSRGCGCVEIHSEEDVDDGIALACSLKYAGDGVELTRL